MVIRHGSLVSGQLVSGDSSMWIIFSAIYCALLLGPLPPPPVDAREEGSLITYDRHGKERWRAQWTMGPITTDGQSLVKFTETGEGYYSPFSQRVRWSVESYWKLGQRFSPLHYEKTFTDMEGVPVVVERRRFDWRNRTVQFEREDRIGDRSIDVELEVPRFTWTSDGVAVALRSFPFDSPRPVKVHLLSDEPKLYEVTFTVKGIDPVGTKSGVRDCYKVKMDVNLGFLNLFKAFVSDIYFWFAVETPHRWVRYQGLESGRGSPEVLRQSIR